MRLIGRLAVCAVIALSSLSGCGTDEVDMLDMYDEVGIDPDAEMNASQQDLAIEDLVRKLPLYYRTLGTGTPEYSQFSIHVVKRDTTEAPSAAMRQALESVRDPIIKTIFYGKKRAVPYAPFHVLMCAIRSMAEYIRDTRKRWRGVVASSCLAQFLYDKQHKDQEPRRQVYFNRLFLGLTEYFRISQPMQSSRLRALEFLELNPFSPTIFLARALNGEVRAIEVEESMKKLADAIAVGFGDLAPEKRDQLVQFTDEFVHLYELVEERSDGEHPDPATLEEFRVFLARIDPLLDEYLT